MKNNKMIRNDKDGLRHSIYNSPWIIMGSVFILLIMVVVLAVRNDHREKEYMSRILKEKGGALIRALEAGTRTGMFGMMWGGQQTQKLVEETALLPDVQYITIMGSHGEVLTSSLTHLIGTQVNAEKYLNEISENGPLKWRMIKAQKGDHSFEVYRYFKPFSHGDGRMHRMKGRRGMMMGRGNGWRLPFEEAGNKQIILISLDPKPFLDSRKTDIRNTVIISGILVTLGLAGFISLFWMQSYRTARKSLQDTSAIADEVVTSLPVGLIATDRDGKIAFSNGAAERITGLHLSDARGKNPEDVLPSHFCGLKESLDQGESIYEKEMECEFIEGKTVPVSVSASKIINEGGQFVGQVLIIRDLDEVRRLKDEIQRKERLAAIGGLAAGVAHEIRNPLSSIKGIATYFKNKFNKEHDDKEMADVMIQEVDRLNRAVSELLEFSRPTDLNPQKTDINSLMEHSMRLIEKEASAKDISIQMDLVKEPIFAEIDSDRLIQCLLNLYLNSLQAMEKGDMLRIKNSLTDDGFLLIKIEDTGPGVKTKDLNRIFDPYYTTKAKGTGLGLAVVHKIIEAHRGNVLVQSKTGQGTIFNIRLPLNSDMRKEI